MVGKVNLYLPGDAELSEKVSKAKEVFSEKGVESEMFRYADEKEAVSLASNAALAGMTSVIAVNSEQYCKVKMMILKVLSVKALRSSIVIKKIGIKLSSNSKEHKIQSAVPVGGKIFPSENGLNSAVSCGYGSGHIILLPLEADELAFAIDAGALEIEEPKKSAKEILTERLGAVEKAGKTLCIAKYGFAKALVSVVESVGISKDVYKQAEVDVDGDPTDKEYIANVAKAARDKYACDYGVAVSSIAEDGTISICVADGDSAKVEVIHPFEDDDDEKLAKAATIKLTEMIAEVANEGITPPERKGHKNDSTPVMIIVSVLVLAAVFCMALGIFVYKKFVESPQNTTAAVSNSVEQSTLVDTEREYGDKDGEVEGSFEETTYKNGINPSTAANGQFTTSKMQVDSRITRGAVNASTSIAAAVGSVSGEGTKKSEGVFTFTVYGYGHGVGMSQRGAIALASQGKTYQQILTYYYQGVTIATDSKTPKTITKGGQEMTLVAFLCKTVAQEIGPSSPAEALKAQAVAAYTFAMHNSFDGQQAFDSSFSYKGSAVEKAVFAVLHITSEDQQPYADYMYYSKPDTYINAVYCASVAGKTTSASSVWSGDAAYLRGGRASPETVEVSTFSITTSEMKTLIENYAAANGLKADLSGDPTTWLKILSHDGSINEKVGYVDRISLGGITMTGAAFRDFLGRRIKSHCFTIAFTRYV